MRILQLQYEATYGLLYILRLPLPDDNRETKEEQQTRVTAQRPNVAPQLAQCLSGTVVCCFYAIGTTVSFNPKLYFDEFKESLQDLEQQYCLNSSAFANIATAI